MHSSRLDQARVEKARWSNLLSDGLKGHTAGGRPRNDTVGNAALVRHLLDLAETDRTMVNFAEKNEDVRMELVFKAELRFEDIEDVV